MNIGERTERVRFVERSRTREEGGDYTTSIAVLGEVWASVVPVAAQEGEELGRRFGSTSYLVEFHADDKPTALMTGHDVEWLTAPGGVAVTMNIRAIRQAKQSVQNLEIVAEAGATPPGPV